MRRLLHLTILCLFTSLAAFAQDRFWVGPANGNWHDPNNWSLTIGGPGGATVPGGAGGAGLTAIFSARRSTNAVVDQPVVDLGGLTLQSGYRGTITQTQPFTVTGPVVITSGTFSGGGNFTSNGSFTLNSGTFILGAGTNVMNGTFTLNNGVFNAGAGTLTFNGNVFILTPASVVPHTGTVIFDGTTSTVINVASTNTASVRFNNIVLDKTSANDADNNLSIANGDTLIATGTLTLTNGNLANVNGVIGTDANVDVQATFDGANGGDLVFTGATNGTANFNAPFGIANNSDIKVLKTNTAAVVSFVTGLGTNTITTNTNANATFVVTSGTVNFPDNDIVDHNIQTLSIGAQGTYLASGGTTNLTGNFANSGTFNGNGGTFAFVGTLNTTFNTTVGGADGTTAFSNLTINKTGTNGIVTIDNGDIMAADGLLQLTDGSLVVVNGAANGPGFIQANGNMTVAATFSLTSGFVGLNFGGAGAQTITFAPGAQGYINGPVNLVKTSNAAVTLASPMVVDFPGQTMTFTSGRIVTTAANILNFGPTAVAVPGNGFVDGPVSKTGVTAFTFPTGDGSVSAPVRMSGNGTFNGAFSGGNKTFVAEYFYTSPGPLYPRDQIQPPADPSLKVSQQEYWRVAQVGTVPMGERPFLWLSYENARSGGLTDIDAVGIAAWLGSDMWSQFGNGGLASNSGFNYLRSGSRNFTTNEIDPVFTFITDDSIANPLPVTWLGFTGRYYNAMVELNWSTALELNNATFTVERSGDGDKYQAIGTIPGRGTVNSTSYYSFIDKEPVPGVNHYRIKQTDIDGKFSYSKEIRVSTAELGQNGLRLFPNPMTASQPLVLENAEWKNKTATVTIYNATGGIVQQQQVTFGADSRSRLNLSRLKKGSYFITTTQADGKKQTLSFIVQ